MKTTPPTKDDFAKLLTDRIRQAGEKGNIVYEAEEFRLRGEGERAPVIFLTNAYKEYCAADEDVREQVVRHWVRNWFSLRRTRPKSSRTRSPTCCPSSVPARTSSSTASEGRSKAASPAPGRTKSWASISGSAWSTTCPSRCGRFRRPTSMPGA